ncbi:MAG: twin-arginine translocase TatA/TatE family subunit [Patescibacteria group bacterium]
MFANIGWMEILIMFSLLLILFGGAKLPKIAKGLGESGKELKKAKKDLNKALEDK